MWWDTKNIFQTTTCAVVLQCCEVRLRLVFRGFAGDLGALLLASEESCVLGQCCCLEMQHRWGDWHADEGECQPAAPFFLASSSLRAWHVWFVSSYAQGSWEAFEDDRGWTDCATLASKPLTSAGSLLPPAGLWSLQHTADRSLLLLISTPQFMHVLLSIASTGRDAGLRCLVLQLLVDWACAVHSPNDEFVPAFAQARHVRSRPMPSLRFGVKG